LFYFCFDKFCCLFCCLWLYRFGRLKAWVLGGAAGFGLSKYMATKTVKTLKKKHAKEIKASGAERTRREFLGLFSYEILTPYYFDSLHIIFFDFLIFRFFFFDFLHIFGCLDVCTFLDVLISGWQQLYTQYYSDVYKLQENLAESNYQAEKLRTALNEAQTSAEMDAIQRDYDEFKQPDVDGDDRISRAEFNMYVKNYLANYPGLKEKDYPKFEDFDHDKDGFVSFTEYAQQMAYQVQQAELEKFYTEGKTGNVKAQALSGLAGEAQKGKNFNDLYANYR